MPILQHGKSKLVDAPILCEFFRKFRAELIVIEHVQAMGQDESRSSMFRFGAAFGAAVASAQLTGLPYVLVPPAKWKRAYGLIGLDKKASHAMARKLFPATKSVLYGPRGGLLIDRAEAVLLAGLETVGSA